MVFPLSAAVPEKSTVDCKRYELVDRYYTVQTILLWFLFNVLLSLNSCYPAALYTK